MATTFSKHSAALCTFLVLAGVVFSHLQVKAQNPVITSFSANGWLTCSNVQPGSTAVVEWASSPAGPWKSTWSGLDAVGVGSNGVFGVAVPMFYRVRGVAPSNSTLPLIESTLANVSVLEGSTAGFGVRLSAQPASTVTVTVASDDTAKATVSPTTLTFTPANYATYQNVTVTGVPDANTLNETTTISLSSAGLAGVSVMVTVSDDDVQTIQTSATTLTVAEGGSASVGVRLSAQPAATVTVTVAGNDPAKATASPTTLTFTPANYATYQNVTVTGVQDANTLNEATSISLTSAGLAGVTVNVTVTDDDVQSIQTSVASLTVGEGGSGVVGVRLAAQPATTVTVSVASSDPAKATATPLSLTFTPANYATYQNVTVSGVNDADTLNETLKLEMSSPGLSLQNVTITVIDDDL